MTESRALLGILLLFGGIVLWWKGKDLKDTIDEALGDGIIPESPESLAAESGYPLEVYSLARAMQSEESGNEARIAVGWAIKNHAAGHITQTVTHARKKDKDGKLVIYKSDGYYGTQSVDPGRYCTTFRSPTSATLKLAGAIMDGTIQDTTSGSVQFDAPELQDKLHAKDPYKYKSSAEIAAKRIKEGKELILVEGVTRTRFWRKARNA